MGYLIRKVSFRAVENEYRTMYSENNSFSAYQDYSYLSLCKRYSHFSASGWSNRVSIMKIVTSTNRIVIAPLLVGKDKIWILGDLFKTGYLDFIYTKDTQECDYIEVIEALRNYYKDKALVLNHLSQKSGLGRFLCDRYDKSYEMPCVSIPLGGVKDSPSPIDAYYNSLSKKVRQNYRTSKNRLKKEGREWRLIWQKGTEIQPDTHEAILQLYLERQKKYDERNRKGIVKTAEQVFHRWINPMQVALRTMGNAYFSLLTIDGTIVAFLAGFMSNDGKTFTIPRLAIRSEYGVYSPGTLLIFETIQKLLKETNVEDFDLSHGEEPYKFAMGGVAHINSGFVLPPIKDEQ